VTAFGRTVLYLGNGDGEGSGKGGGEDYQGPK
jgi:hypothetical protein